LCSYANTGPTANLSITKTKNATSMVRGQTNTYNLVAINAGRDAVANAILKDPAPNNLTGCILGTRSFVVLSGVATCPTLGS